MINKPKIVASTQIYLDCRRMLDTILDITPNFPKAYKFSIGNRMQDIAINLMATVAAAYVNKDRQVRLQHLTDFQADFEVLKTLIRIAGERRWILGRGKHADLIELMDNIGKQANAWKRSLRPDNM